MEKDLYYRGYSSCYAPFENKEQTSFTWITDDPLYALEYAEDEDGVIATVRLLTTAIAPVASLPEEMDLYDPEESEMQKLYKCGMHGFWFEANQGDSLCICINKQCVELLKIQSSMEFKISLR